MAKVKNNAIIVNIYIMVTLKNLTLTRDIPRVENSQANGGAIWDKAMGKVGKMLK